MQSGLEFVMTRLSGAESFAFYTTLSVQALADATLGP
jgi:hypothetical protein